MGTSVQTANRTILSWPWWRRTFPVTPSGLEGAYVLGDVRQTVGPLLDREDNDTRRQGKLGIGRSSRVELHQEHGAAVLLAA